MECNFPGGLYGDGGLADSASLGCACLQESQAEMGEGALQLRDDGLISFVARAIRGHNYTACLRPHHSQIEGEGGAYIHSRKQHQSTKGTRKRRCSRSTHIKS